MPLPVWTTYVGIDIIRISEKAYTYKTSHVAIDADGSPRAYGPGDIGLDYNANAGYKPGSNGWHNVLVADPVDQSRPYVQTKGPTKGFFVSTTTLYDENDAVPATDPAKYVDAGTIPYIVFPGGFYAKNGTGGWGDVAIVRSLANGKESAAIVADGGPKNDPLGEISIALASALGGVNPNPRNGRGTPPTPLQYVIFPYSRIIPAWPRTAADITAQAQALLAAAGGWPDI
jgi:hypothetical protein